MNATVNNPNQNDLFNKSSYNIASLDDEVRADQLCAALLKIFHKHLLNELFIEPLQAGTMAAGTDYYLRNFMIDNQRENIFDCTARSIRRFAGHWYIISHMEPNLAELTPMLKGTESFYQFCADRNLITSATATAIANACNDFDYYQIRIESFLSITGDGYSAWEKACPLT